MMTKKFDTVTEKTEYGLKVFSELLGDKAADAMRAAVEGDGFASDIARLATHNAFADVWGDDKLERKQRSLVTLGVLIAQRQTSELKNHVRIAVRNGLTARELEGVLVQAMPYCGFPAVASATTAMLETLRELGIETTTKTSEERGLL
jgi:4-carboxymuconolactone decarboxylase